MTLRETMTTLLAAALLLVTAEACAANPPLGGRPPLRDTSAGYELTVLVDGVPTQTYIHGGETYVLGHLGARYTLRVSNHTGRRIEAVLSVDGRDVIDGRPADFRSKRGYLVPAWGAIDIDGWRISRAQAAAFRFSTVPDAYAARTGSAREVGVVGVAIFPERYVPPPIAYPRRPLELPRDDYGYRGRGPAPADGSGGDVPPAADAAPAPNGAAPGSAPPAAPRARAEAQASRERPGLGTEYGESVTSPIYEVEFVRANAVRPAVLLGLRYNDRDGLLAMGIPVDGAPDTCFSDLDLRRTAEPFPTAGPVSGRFAAPPPGWQHACEWR